MADLNLDQYLNANSSLHNLESDTTIGYQFDYQTERSSVGNVQLRNASIDNAKMGTAVIGTAQIGTLSFNEISGGTISVVGAIGGTNIKIDGANKRIVVNDGTVNRIYLGSI